MKEKGKKLNRKRSKLAAGNSHLNSLQLLEDFRSPDLTNSLQVTPDERYLLLCGAYKPVMKCFDLETLAVKFSRGLDETTFQTVCLSEDYSRLALRQDNRYIEFHNAGGVHHRLRSPNVCFDMTFSKRFSDLYLVGKSADIWRLNLEAGCFQSQPMLKSQNAQAFTSAILHDQSCLLMAGTSQGDIEAYDLRMNGRDGPVASLKSPFSGQISPSPHISCQLFRTPLQLAVGYSHGVTSIFDIRQSQPFTSHDQGLSQPVLSLSFTSDESSSTSSSSVVSCDMSTLHVWSGQPKGQVWCAFNFAEQVNSVVRVPNSGLILGANDDAPHIQTYFVPALGRAPAWCPNLLGYLRDQSKACAGGAEPTAAAVDSATVCGARFRLLTRTEVSRYGLDSLMGTEALMAHNHLFAISQARFLSVLRERGDEEALAEAGQLTPELLAQNELRQVPSRLALVAKLKSAGGEVSGGLRNSAGQQLEPDQDIVNLMRRLADERDYLRRIVRETERFRVNRNHPEFRLLEAHLTFKSKKAKIKERRRKRAALADQMAGVEEIAGI